MCAHLFSEDANHKTNAHLDLYEIWGDESNETLYWALYAEGFKRIADMAVDEVRQASTNRHALVYPIVSNYRHYIELRLKEVIKDGNKALDEAERLTDDQMKTLFQGKEGHNLMTPWEHYYRVVTKICPDDPKKTIEDAKKRIAQFAQVDPFGMAGRYPMDTKGKRSFSGHVDTIGIENLHTCIGEIAELLDGMSAMMGVYWEWHGEMATEMRSYADYGR